MSDLYSPAVLRRSDMLVPFDTGGINKTETILKALARHTGDDGKPDYRKAYADLAIFVGAEIVHVHKGQPRTIGARIGETSFVYDLNVIGRHRSRGSDARRTQNEKFLGMCWKLAQTFNGEKRDFKDPQPQVPQPEPQPEPQEVPQPRENDDLEQFLTWVESVQDYQLAHGIVDEGDGWGMRQALNGKKLILAGMPVAAIKDAFTIDFDDEARSELGVRPFDLTAWGATIAQDDESAIEAVIGVTIKAGVNACAVGGKGIGKTTTFEKIAEKAGAKIAVISCSPDGIRPDLFGTLTPGIREGYVLAEVAEVMLKAEAGEKVFILLDEADALTPSDGTKLNRALEQRKISHPFLGRTIDFGKNVQFFAAMNTTGNGADENFTARDKQDAAFLDRFFRFRAGLDRKLQRRLFDATTI